MSGNMEWLVDFGSFARNQLCNKLEILRVGNWIPRVWKIRVFFGLCICQFVHFTTNTNDFNLLKACFSFSSFDQVNPSRNPFLNVCFSNFARWKRNGLFLFSILYKMVWVLFVFSLIHCWFCLKSNDLKQRGREREKTERKFKLQILKEKYFVGFSLFLLLSVYHIFQMM